MKNNVNKNIIIKTLRHPLVKKLLEAKALPKRELIKLIIQESILNETPYRAKDGQPEKNLKTLADASKKHKEAKDFLDLLKTKPEPEALKKVYHKASLKFHPHRSCL